MRKCLRSAGPEGARLLRAVQCLEKSGLSLNQALCRVLLDASYEGAIRQAAARVLALSNTAAPVQALTRRFLEEDNRAELIEIAKLIRELRMPLAVPALIQALDASKLDTREAAAYALGFPDCGMRAVQALSRVLTDSSELAHVRGLAAESLHGQRKAIPVLLSVLSDPAVEVRFWAVWALGTAAGRMDPTVMSALGRKLTDQSVYPGWWSVARGALAVLGTSVPSGSQYRQQFDHELARVSSDVDVSPEDRRWAEFWG
jgi:HEAT repeat protein